MFHTRSQIPQEIWDQHPDVALAEPKAISFSKACLPSTSISLLCCFLHPPTTLFYISNTWHFKVFLLLSTVHLNIKIENKPNVLLFIDNMKNVIVFTFPITGTKRRPPMVGKKKKRNNICLTKMFAIQRVIKEWWKAAGWSQPESSSLNEYQWQVMSLRGQYRGQCYLISSLML